MDITYKNKKIEKVCTDAKAAEKTYGREMAEKWPKKYIIVSMKLLRQTLLK